MKSLDEEHFAPRCIWLRSVSDTSRTNTPAALCY